jgi:hypothetical protein
MYIAIGWVSSIIYVVSLRRENKKRDRGERDEIIDGVVNERARPENGHFASVEHAKREKGDEWSGFRYNT